MLKINKGNKTAPPTQDLTEEENHKNIYAKYYKSGVLHYDIHNRMVMNLEFYAVESGIPMHYLYSKCKHLLLPCDLAYLASWRDFQDKEIVGAFFTKQSEKYIERMYAIVAIMLRNLIDAKFITIQALVSSLKNNQAINSKVVCIPNFCLTKKKGGDVASWELSSIVGWLLERQSRGQQTIIYVDNPKLIEEQYGVVVSNMCSNYMCPLD